MALGVPGPAGATGAAGTNGTNGVGVPTGGTAGQVLSKINSTNYNTQWTSPSGGTWGSITGTLSNQTDLQSALSGKLSLSGGTMTGAVNINLTHDGDFAGTLGLKLSDNDNGVQISVLSSNNALIKLDCDLEHPLLTLSGYGSTLSLSDSAITFPDSSVQTTAGLPLTGGTMSGQLIINETTTTYIGDGVQVTDGTNSTF
jgi:hypothetical protein